MILRIAVGADLDHASAGTENGGHQELAARVLRDMKVYLFVFIAIAGSYLELPGGDYIDGNLAIGNLRSPSTIPEAINAPIITSGRHGG